MKKIIILLSTLILSSCGLIDDLVNKDKNKNTNTPSVIPATLLQPAHKTIILQSSNNYTDNISLTFPRAENAQITVTTDSPDVLVNGMSSFTLFFNQSNYDDPQEIHFSTSLKSVTNVCYGKEFKLIYTITDGSSNTYTQEEKGYIIDENHSTNFYLNPNGNAPLSVTANIITSEPTTLEYSIFNKDATDISVSKKFSNLANEHNINIYGLYENHLNYIEVKGRKSDGSLCFQQKVPVQTSSLNISGKNLDGTLGTAMKIKPDKIDNSWILLQLNGSSLYKLILDLDGNIRWALLTNEDAAPVKFIQDSAGGIDMVEVLNFNGTAITYYDMAGKSLTDKNITNLYKVHHDSVNIPESTTMLILANMESRDKTIDDMVAEYNTADKLITQYYDLSQLLPIDRKVNIVTFIEKNPTDYLHTNSIEYDTYDSGVIVSARHQGVFKFDRNFKNVKWIIAPHDGWSGYNIDHTPVDLTDKLLTPVDMNNNAITDDNVLKGYKADEKSGFDWPWAQHNAKILSRNGDVLTLIVYDNGDNRHRKGELGIGQFNPDGYSRAVIYEINEKNMTIKQIWQAGKELGTNGYSQIMSNAERLSNGNIQMHSAFTVENEGISPHASYFEFEYSDMKNPVYQLILPMGFAYRAYRINPFDVMK